MGNLSISVIRAAVGGYVGHSTIHEVLIKAAKEKLTEAKKNRTILDFYVTHCGDDRIISKEFFLEVKILTQEEKEIEEKEINKLGRSLEDIEKLKSNLNSKWDLEKIEDVKNDCRGP